MNDGSILKAFLKNNAIKMGEFATLLNMTRQNLNYHLRKEKLDGDFERLIKIVGGIERKNDNYIRLTKQEIESEKLIFNVPFLSSRDIPAFINCLGAPEFISALSTLPLKRINNPENSLIIEIQDEKMSTNNDKSIKEGDLFLAERIDFNQFEDYINSLTKVYLFFTKKDGVICSQILNYNKENETIECIFWNTTFKKLEINTKDIFFVTFLKKLVERKLII